MQPNRHLLFSAVKNEAPFLLEWIAYHRVIGFERIILASNNSDDGTTELLEALASAGLIAHLPHSVAPGQSPQGRAADLFNGACLVADGDWMLWLDADEFLNIHIGRGLVLDLVAHMEAARAMLIPWRIFGDGHNPAFPGRHISPQFTRAALPEFPGNRQIKTLYRHNDGATRLSRVALHRPHLLRPEPASRVLNAAGHGIDPGFAPNLRWLEGQQGKALHNISARDCRWDLAQINHYIVRTREMFALKAHRGRGFVNKPRDSRPALPRHTPEFFAEQNRNEAEDRSILRHEAATSHEIAQLLAHPTVAAAHAEGLRRTAARLAAIGPL